MSKRNKRPRRRMRANEFLLNMSSVTSWQWDEHMKEPAVPVTRPRIKVPNPRHEGAAEAKTAAAGLAKNLMKRSAWNGSPHVFEVGTDEHVRKMERLSELWNRRVNVFMRKLEEKK